MTASDPETGERSSTAITLSSGLSDQDLQRILSEDRTDRVKTAVGPAAGAAGTARSAAVPLGGDELEVLDEGEIFDGEGEPVELISTADLGGDPGEVVPLGKVDLAAGEDQSDREQLFDSSEGNLSGDLDDEAPE